MNQTALIALLELKGIITRAEGEKLVEFLNNRPQSTLLADAVTQVEELVSKGASFLGDVAKTAEKAAQRVADKAVDVAKEEAKVVASEAVDTAAALARGIAEDAETAGAKTDQTK